MARWVARAAVFASAFSLLLYELLLTRVFAIVLFADLAHLALGVAMLGVSVGALAVHLFPSLIPVDSRPRLSLWLSAQGLTSVAAAAFALGVPAVASSEAWTWYARDPKRFELLDEGRFVALLAVAAIPAACAGVVLAGAFLRYAEDLPRVYAADLLGAGVAAAAFLGLLAVFPAPDLVFVALGVAGVGATIAGRGASRAVGAAVAAAGLAAVVGSTQAPVLRVRYAAGWDEAYVVAERWSPVGRLALFRGPAGKGIAGDYLLIDNGSASLVSTSSAQDTALAAMVNRSAVYALYPGAQQRTAILAAGAGPEVAVATSFGQRDVTAIDLAPEMFSLVREAYPGRTPFDRVGVRTVSLDARTAIRHDPRPFGIIQLVQANFLGAAGLLSSAWSPHLLYTVEAVGEYLAHLSPGGTLSMSSAEPDALDATVRAAVIAAGHDPRPCVRRLGGNNAVILARNDAFSAADDAVLARLDPSPTGASPARVLTDDRPYADAIADVPGALRGESGPVRRVLVRSLAVQLAAAAAAGALFLGLPLVLRGRRELAPGWGPAVLFSAGLGYGWFTVEVALLHRLVVFVGHPTWAVAGVVAAMLVGTGIGSLWVADRPTTRGGVIQAVMLALAAITVTSAVLVPGAAALQVEAFGLRMGLAMLAIFPMAVALGRPMPLGLRFFGARDPGLVSWMWAVNGWGSVAASLLTVAVVRYFGYQAAFWTASAAYVLAFLVLVVGTSKPTR